MTETKLVMPAKDRHVVSPNGTPVPPKFKVNPADPYWARLLRDRDIVEAADQSTTPAASEPQVVAPGDKK